VSFFLRALLCGLGSYKHEFVLSPISFDFLLIVIG